MADGQTLLDAAQLWLERGWHPIPTTGADGKVPARKDLTGYDGVNLTADQLPAAFNAPGVHGLGLRMPDGVLGIDQDGYDGKTGPESIAALEAELGVTLPPAPMISGRLDGRSGIRFYQVPTGLHWTATALNAHGGGVELIHAGHRHAKAWPSTHHRTGLTLGRLDVQPGELVATDDDGEPWLLPPPDELPWLPPELVAALTERQAPMDARAAVEWTNPHGHDPDWATSVKLAMDIWRGRSGSRFEAMRDAQVRLVRLDSLGQAGATAALVQLRDEYVAAVPERDAAGEYDRALNGAMGKVATTEPFLEQGKRLVREVFRRLFTEADTERQRDLPDGTVVHITTNLPAAFWDSRPALAHIRDAAWSRTRSPDALFGAVLARLSAITPPLYRIPAIVGSPSTLSAYVALVGPSGTGKTTSADIARELLPIQLADIDQVVEHALGSGEGLVELFMGEEDTGETTKSGKAITRRAQTKRGAVVTLDEGQALAEMGGRKGATLLPTLRTMWTGGQAGQANAQAENTRKLKAGGYALGFIIGLQPSLAADLLDDTAAGTPQRFLWLSTTDPAIPDMRPAWPGPLGHRTPPRPKDGRSVPELEIAPSIVAEVSQAALERNRGTSVASPLESHRDLARLKVAGLLAVLDGRLCVTEGDWTLAGIVCDTSTAVREATQEVLRGDAIRREAQADDRAARRAKAVKAAEHEVEDTEYTKALEAAAGTVARRARKVGQLDERAARHAMPGRLRKLVTVTDALQHAVEAGWLTPVGNLWTAGPKEP